MGLVALSSGPCASTGPRQATPFERIGGAPVLKAVTSETIDIHASSPDGKAAFRDVKLPRLKKHNYDRYRALADGPCQYTGDEMRTVHGGLHTTERQMYGPVTILRGTPDRRSVGQRDEKEHLRLLAPMKRAIDEEPATKAMVGASEG